MVAQAEQITWETNLVQAQQRATQAGKVLLVDFSAAPE